MDSHLINDHTQHINSNVSFIRIIGLDMDFLVFSDWEYLTQKLEQLRDNFG